MKPFTISAAVALLAALAQAAPAPNADEIDARDSPSATLVFYAAAVTTTLFEPTGTVFPINLDSLNIDRVWDNSAGTCTLTGSNGETFTVAPSTTVTIGPPQPLVSGICQN